MWYLVRDKNTGKFLPQKTLGRTHYVTNAPPRLYSHEGHAQARIKREIDLLERIRESCANFRRPLPEKYQYTPEYEVVEVELLETPE